MDQPITNLDQIKEEQSLANEELVRRLFFVKKKIGRPRKIDQPNNGISNSMKRGRGRPRKYPIKEAEKLAILRRIVDLVELTKEPGMASVWGGIKKGKRVNRIRGPGFLNMAKNDTVGLEFSTLEEPDFMFETESDHSSVVTGLSDSKNDEDVPWIEKIVIPGPVPDLNALFWNEIDYNLSKYYPEFFCK